MAFVDTLLTDTDARIVMADRHHRPGGHWNEPCTGRAPQPAAYYGVNSRAGQGTKDTVGLNAGTACPVALLLATSTRSCSSASRCPRAVCASCR
ncbi:MAG: hypothetical protein IPO59_17870 [Betaproteobacteria bacterium]|nr:hypothetical protein [Betaproteobacteria bacterium]